MFSLRTRWEVHGGMRARMAWLWVNDLKLCQWLSICGAQGMYGEGLVYLMIFFSQMEWRVKKQSAKSLGKIGFFLPFLLSELCKGFCVNRMKRGGG